MKRIGGNAIALLILSAVLVVPLLAQQASAANSDLIEPEAMEACAGRPNHHEFGDTLSGK